jgi:hypothetical protein
LKQLFLEVARVKLILMHHLPPLTISRARREPLDGE